MISTVHPSSERAAARQAKARFAFSTTSVISISPTERSPELSFDTTLVNLHWDGNRFAFGQYGILELQTMDYHGTYKKAVENLRHALDLHTDHFAEQVQANQRWLSEHVEGPNIANVFKRTFYQMMLKFQVAGDETCAGCVLAIPASVWDSWQRHLGRPRLQDSPDGTWILAPEGEDLPHPIPAWIYVFDIDQTSGLSPNALNVVKVIATNADAVGHYALKIAPQAAVAGAGERDRVLAMIRTRLAQWWPELGIPAL